ncbi:MAG TPA: response regulator [Candidatus Binatia bacterium]|nr:response regulator [Candidatus Binatia bacterium]
MSPVSSDDPILIVEDTEDHRDLLGIVLRRAGYRVAYALDGRDAFHRLESGLRPSLIVLDLAMPNMDGLEFRARQLADARYRDIPVIIVSAVKDSDTVRRELGLPALQKPFDPDAILSCVERHLPRP